MSRKILHSLLWKLSASFVCVALVLSPFAGMTVRVASAAGEGSGGIADTPTPVAAPGVLVTDIQQAREIDKVKKRMDYQLLFPLYLGVLNAATMLAQQLAYDTAVWVSNGGKGAMPLYEALKFGDYTKQLAYDAAGEFIGTISEKFTKGAFGIDLCRPPRFQGLIMEFALRLPTYHLNGLNRPRPACEWTDIVSSWEATKDSLTEGQVLRNINASFSTGGNDVSFGLGVNLGFLDLMAERREAGILDRLEGKGFKSAESLISGKITTPASVVEQSVIEQIVRQPNASQNISTAALLNNAFELGWVQLGSVTLSTFSNVLVSRLLGKITKGLFDTSGSKGLTIPDFANADASPLGSSDTETIISEQFSDILTPKIASSEAQDLLGELLGCPDAGRTKWNCAIDSSLEVALRQGGMTVRQAIDSGYLNGNFQLIPSTQIRDNLDSGCVNRAFCVSNLRKMRLARIIPIGWELAADSPANQKRCASGSCITLKEAIDHFNDCNDLGTLDADHPWCHLIDQNWVLSSFQAQCLTNGYGNSFITGTDQRMQECQDSVTCLEKDANGKCQKGYGYCLAEQTYYQFDALTCQEQNVSCRSYTPRGSNAKSVGYLRSTLDYGVCDASNVGCMWYSAKRNPAYVAGVSTDIAEWSASSTDRIYFNKNVEKCDASGDGCTDLRRVVKSQSSLNLIRNSSFEDVSADTKALEYWVNKVDSFTADKAPIPYVQPTVGTGSASYAGSNAYLVDRSMNQYVSIQEGRQYTISYYARAFSGSVGQGGIAIRFFKPNTGADPRIPPSYTDPVLRVKDTAFYRSANCSPAGSMDGGGEANEALLTLPSNLSTEWRRMQCSFVAPPGTAWAVIRLVSAGSWLVDAVQLEESEVATKYEEGLNPNLTPTYLKVPPVELGCTGEESSDNPLCSNYARVCRAYEAGCQGYTSQNQPSAPEVPAVLSSVDLCPAECVGYAQFRKEASTFDLIRNPDIDALNDPDDESFSAFIPDTGKSCSAQDVGCEAFTVIDDLSAGGESARAYSYLKLCEKPNDDTQTYYTWEGSEASGYQLVTWSLQKDTYAPVPQGPVVVVRAGSDGKLKDPNACNAVTYLVGSDPDCRQFYDPQGNAFYRYESQTVLASESCAQMRKTGSSKADCEKTGGAYDVVTGICLYQAMAEESKVCSSEYAGCRAYVGTKGGAQSSIFEQDFGGVEYEVDARTGVMGLSLSEESVLVGDHSLRAAIGASEGEVSFDVPTERGMLYELSFWAKGTQSSPYDVTVKVSNPSMSGDALTEVGTATVKQQWNVYRIGPFTGSGSLYATSTRIHLSGFKGSVAFIDAIRVTQVTDVAYVVKDSWETPAVCDQTSSGIAQEQAMLGCRNYVDRNQRVVPVRQFTNLCRQSSIGCSAFIDTQNSESPFEQRWTKAERQSPSSDIVPDQGTCMPNNFIYSSDSVRTNVETTLSNRACTTDYECRVTVGGTLFEGRCDVRLTVHPADQFAYYIDDGSMVCKQSQTGCRSFGLPKYDQTRLASVKSFDTVYLKNDVSKYSDALCSEDELFCESYTYNASGQAGTEYFKAPSDHACEYREGVVVARTQADGTAVPVAENCSLPNAQSLIGTTYNGWFRVGTDCPCYPERLSLGKNFGILLTGDVGFNALAGDPAQSGSDYQAWTGLCPETQAECTEFRDVNDQSDPLHPLGRPYFVINDERLDKETCNGKVDPGNGCVLFRDLSDTSLTANSLATFKEYVLQGNHPVAPVDCTLTPDLQACIDAKEELLNDIVSEAMVYITYKSAWNSSGANISQLNATLFDTCYSNNRESDLRRRRIQCIADALDDGDQVAQREKVLALLNEYNVLFDSELENDTNIVIKVKSDRSCSQWLACKTGETVYDQSLGQYKSICSQLELCNKAGSDQGEGIPYCESYLNRERYSLDTILRKFEVLSAEQYASRPVGFGKVDYSGYSIPDQFSVADTSLEPVGSELSVDSKSVSSFKKDYRLNVKVPIGAYARIATDLDEKALAGLSMKAFACYFLQTGSYGLLTDANGIVDANKDGVISTGESVYCAVSVDQSQPPQGVTGASLVSENLNTLMIMNRLEQTEQPELDQLISRSFPNTQCKAAPQPDAPFGNEFVSEWDSTVNPPVPSRASLGYGNANFCEYGEECSCTYKRVQYGRAGTKFYEPLSTDVVNAICSGGTRDGLPCVPDSGIEGSQAINVTVNNSTAAEGEAGSTTISAGSATASAEDDSMRCGEGGVCTPISKVTLVRGITGQCLQYDLSRPIAGNQSRNECLIWNPTPVLSGPSDPYHWDPTAGYQPPQSSGRYYCTAPVREPREQSFHAATAMPKHMPKEGFSWEEAITTVVLGGVPTVGPMYLASISSGPSMSSDCGKDNSSTCTASFGPLPNSEGTYAGRIKNFFYADWFTSDGSCSNFGPWGGCTGNESGASLDGRKAAGTTWGGECEDVDDEGQAFVADDSLMRLVTTGQGAGRSYAEYAILFNPADTAYGALGFSPGDWETIFEYSLEDVIANFEFSVPKRKLACAYTAPWADVSVSDYDDETEWKNGDKSWHSTFSSYLAKGGMTLNRSTARIVTEDGTLTGIPVKVDCMIKSDSGESGTSLDVRGGEDGMCYLKSWQLDYRADGQQKFQAFSEDIGRSSLDHLSRRPVYGRCDSANPWFSIRAVFEDTNPVENSRDPLEVTADQLVGPFQFVGLWVTACAPGNQTQYIYMDMKMNSADVCRELAETISADSNESVVFTDRNSAFSGYSLKNGFNWDTKNVPYGASLATGDASTQPLFMTGVKQKDVNPMNPPTFTSSGQTYFSSAPYPTNNWGLLSNVFAKIYRIYGYDSRAVSRYDYACTDDRSPQFGQWCPPVYDLKTRAELANDLGKSVADLTSSEDATTQEGASANACGFEGRCVRGGIDSTQMYEQKTCNSLSGLNRGLDCTTNPDVCHIAAMRLDGEGNLTPQYASCSLFSGYYPTSSDIASNGNVKQTIDQKWELLSNGRYRCTGDDCKELCKYIPASGSTEATGATGCSRANAVKEGAFRCSGGSVRDPDKVKEYVSSEAHPTYASYCTRETDESTECPMEISGVKCVNIKSGIGVCQGYAWAQCQADSDCEFSARNFWPSGTANTFFRWVGGSGESYQADLGQFSNKFPERLGFGGQPIQGEQFYYAIGNPPFLSPGIGGSAIIGDTEVSYGENNTWFVAYDEDNVQVNSEAYKSAFWPVTPFYLCESCGGPTLAVREPEDGNWFYATRLVYNNSLSGLQKDAVEQTALYQYWDDRSKLNLYPGFNPHVWWEGDGGETSANIYRAPDALDGGSAISALSVPLSLERVIDPVALEETKEVGIGAVTYHPEYLDPLQDISPYINVFLNDGFDVTRFSKMNAHYGACESNALMFRSGDSTSKPLVSGVCRGGGSDGKVCGQDSDCVPTNIPSSFSSVAVAQTASESWCNPVTTGPSGEPAYSRPGDGSADDCWPAGSESAVNRPSIEDDPAKDSNLCTHPAGYWPKPQYCPDPTDEYCGLFGYDLKNIGSSVSDKLPLPTDVTQGLYTPLYLRPSGVAISKNPSDYAYVDYYNPMPPHTAAPDTRTCQGQQCRVTKLDTFSLDGVTEGVVNGGVGSHVATIRFYAWASHDQMPIKKVYINWGDGTRTELPDSYMKNRKPYCGVEKECTNTPGLTCQSDADCPVGGGQCVMTGSCSTDPTRSCTKDSQCSVGGEDGICEARTYFGNSEDACEETYFEFRHAYSCNSGAKPPTCNDNGVNELGYFCVSEPWSEKRTCGMSETDTSLCGKGDVCVSNVSTIKAGCFSESKKACIYTPQIMVVDNWGWCTGECRNAIDSFGNLYDKSSLILHPNGGCYDASLVKRNYDTSTVIGSSECTENAGNRRPWIVFPGSIQILPGKEL